MIALVPRSRLAALETEDQQLRSENQQLRAALVTRDEQVAGLVSLAENLKAQLAELKARLGSTSRNSSKPPSSDGTEVPKRRGRPKTGRKRGGQAGHPAATRPLAPAEDVTHFEVVWPPSCGQCGQKLAGEDPDPLRHQFYEVEQPKQIITEYQMHRLVCGHCGATTRGQLPQRVSASNFGPRAHALVAILVGQFRQDKRGVQALLVLLYGLWMSVWARSARWSGGCRCRWRHRWRRCARLSARPRWTMPTRWAGGQ